MIAIKEVNTKKDLRSFAKYPVKLYKDCPYYVPSLRSDEMNTFDPEKNFSIKDNICKGFLAYKDGKLVGRILGLIDVEDNKLKGIKSIRFSRFECIDDIDVFKALLGCVERFGKDNGMETIHGPWGFNDTDREGMLTYGFDERSTYATNYYYPYFSKHMKELGFEDESKWIERRFKIPDEPYERILTISEKLKARYKLVDVAESMPMSKIIKLYGDKMFETYNEAYGGLDGFVPIDGKQMENVKKQFATIINPRYLSMLIDENGDCAAFGIVLPSICKPLIKYRGKMTPLALVKLLMAIKKPKELEMALIGVKDSYKNTGINSILIARIMKNVIDDNIENIESNPMLETNYDIQQQWKFAENEVIKKRQTYKKGIGTLADYFDKNVFELVE